MRKQTFFFWSVMACVCLAEVHESTASDPIEIALKPMGADGVYVSHRDFVAYTTRLSTYWDSVRARFEKVGGLADPKAISFRSLSDPDHYLRHRGGRLLLTRCTTELDKKDATFYPVEALIRTAKGGVSLESQNFPGHFLRRKGTELWVEKREDNDQYRADATFLLAEPGAFKAVNLPTGKWVLPDPAEQRLRHFTGPRAAAEPGRVAPKDPGGQRAAGDPAQLSGGAG